MPGTQDQPREDQTLPCGWKPTRSKVASEIPKTRDTGLLPRHGISKSCELKGRCTLCSSYLKKKKEAKRKCIQKCWGWGAGRTAKLCKWKVARLGGSGLQSQHSWSWVVKPGLQSETLSQQTKKKKGSQRPKISGLQSTFPKRIGNFSHLLFG